MRERLGSASTLGSRVYVYLGQEGIEIDEIEGFRGTRKRVLFDEVRLLTWHRARSLSVILVLLGWMIFIGVCAGIGASAAEQHQRPGADTAAALIALAFSAPFLIALVIYLAFGTDHVTVFGKRSTAQIRFLFRKARGRAVYEKLVRAVSEAQQKTAVTVPDSQPAGDASGGVKGA